MKLETKAILGIVLLAAILVPVSAFGVSSQYWTGQDLYLMPGESKVIYFELQNMIGDTDMASGVEILKGQELLLLEEAGKVYSVPAKTQGIKVPIKVSIPSEAKIGTSYPVSVLFKPAVTPTGGMVGIGTAYEQQFNVVVGSKEQPAPAVVAEQPIGLAPLYLALVLVVLFAAVAYGIYKSKRK